MIATQVQAVQHRWQQLLDWLLTQQPRYILILQLTAVLVLLHEIDQFAWIRIPERLLALAMLCSPSVNRSKSAWLALSALLLMNNLWHWFLLVNHEYLLTYWVLTCTVAIYAAAPGKVLAWNAKLLVGLCFAFATVWKFLGGEYLDGSFLHLTFLLDERLAAGAFLIGGLDEPILQQNRTLFDTIQSTGNINPQALQSSPRMALMSLILSYWTIFIEAITALAFLLPRPRQLAQLRYVLLLVFIFTTYLAIPVFAFGALLLIMGLASCMETRSQWSPIYLGTLLLLPLWMGLPQVLFSLR